MIQNLSVERVWKQWLKMIRAAQRADGVLPGIVPTAGYSYTWGNGPLWDSVIIELPYQAYIYRGDLSLFREISDTVMRYLNYLAGQAESRRFACLRPWRLVSCIKTRRRQLSLSA